jgi:hypothetical protein
MRNWQAGSLTQPPRVQAVSILAIHQSKGRTFAAQVLFSKGLIFQGSMRENSLLGVKRICREMTSEEIVLAPSL